MIDLLRRRRSVRRFERRPIEEEKRQILAEALLRAPSSRDRRPLRFTFVDEPELLKQLSRAKRHGSAFMAGAPLAVVILADEAVSDVWIEDSSIAAILLQMTALSLGLGSCWVQIRLREHDSQQSAEDYVHAVLGIPASLRVGCIVAIGYPAESPHPIPFEKLEFERIHRNRLT
ncbi:MAG: nitroreductase family protein [candidate division KSB1 bacterium]|nr:nitroreductase family protein [candidate division KSB1 bacterium]